MEVSDVAVAQFQLEASGVKNDGVALDGNGQPKLVINHLSIESLNTRVESIRPFQSDFFLKERRHTLL